MGKAWSFAVAFLLLARRARAQGADPRSLQRQCDRGNAQSCANLAVLYRDGNDVPRDDTRAVALFGAACDRGHQGACGGLADLLVAGRGVERDRPRALALYRQACDGGYAEACSNLASHYLFGTGVTKDERRAVDLYQAACDGGWPPACYYLGYTYFHGLGVKRDISRAVKLYLIACDKNSAQGCFESGALLADGNQVPQSYERAAVLYQRACDLDATSTRSELEGAGKACANLGVLYEYGRGVRADLSRAVDLYERGCQDGNSIGCLNTGNMLGRGAGRPRDLDKAAKLLAGVCDTHDAGLTWVQACRGLAWVLILRAGGKAQAQAILAHLDQNCSAGKAQDCYVAGLMLDIGDIVVGDRDRAVALLRTACQGKYEAACMELKRIEQSPTPAAPPSHPEKKGSCQEECKRLFAQKELRDGITAEECIAQTCRP